MLELLVLTALYVMHIEELVEELAISLSSNDVLKIDFISLMLLKRFAIKTPCSSGSILICKIVVCSTLKVLKTFSVYHWLSIACISTHFFILNTFLIFKVVISGCDSLGNFSLRSNC